MEKELNNLEEIETNTKEVVYINEIDVRGNYQDIISEISNKISDNWVEEMDKKFSESDKTYANNQFGRRVMFLNIFNALVSNKKVALNESIKYDIKNIDAAINSYSDLVVEGITQQNTKINHLHRAYLKATGCTASDMDTFDKKIEEIKANCNAAIEYDENMQILSVSSELIAKNISEIEKIKKENVHFLRKREFDIINIEIKLIELLEFIENFKIATNIHERANSLQVEKPRLVKNRPSRNNSSNRR